MTLLDKLNALEADKDELAYWSPRYGKWMPGLTISEVRAMAEALEAIDMLNATGGADEPRSGAIAREALQETK